MILVNGIPKSGTHALLKAVELLGVTAGQIVLDHIPYNTQFLDNIDKHLYIIRHPRNVLISYCRWKHQPVTGGMLIGFMHDFMGKTFTTYCQDFIPWLTDQNAFVVKYEDLMMNDAVIRSIADHLNIIYLEDAFPNLPGLTPTWTGNPSDWTTIWNPEIDAEWQLQCQSVQEEMGY